MSTDRRFPPGTIPAAIVTMILFGLLLTAGALGVSALLRGCDRPTQMLPSPMPAASSAAIATSYAQVVATQSVRVTVRRAIASSKATLDYSNGQTTFAGSNDPVIPDRSADDQGEEIVIEVSQAIAAAATSSAQASASVDHVPDPRNMVPDHGRLGVAAATMPGILAADAELARIDVPPWLVGVPLELGMDVAGNLEAGALGVSAGGKAFAGVYGWSRWNLSAQGLAVAVGLRF